FGFELAAADEFLEIANNGAARDVELPGQRRDVGALTRFSERFANAILTTQPIGGPAEEIESVNAPGAFERLKLAHGFLFAALFQGSRDSAFKRVNIHRFGQAVVGAARTLQRLKLLMDFQGAGNNYNWNEGKKLFEFGKE